MSIPPGNQPREPEFFNKGLQIRFGYKKSNDSIEVFKKSNIIQRFVHFFIPGLAGTEKITDSTKEGNFYYVKKSDIEKLKLQDKKNFEDVRNAIMNQFYLQDHLSSLYMRCLYYPGLTLLDSVDYLVYSLIHFSPFRFYQV